MSEKIDKYFKVIAEKDRDNWIPKPKGLYGKLFLRIVNDAGRAVEIDIEELKKDNPKTSINSVVSAFYSWTKRDSTIELLDRMNLNIKIVKKGDKVGIVKSIKSPAPPKPRGTGTTRIKIDT